MLKVLHDRISLLCIRLSVIACRLGGHQFLVITPNKGFLSVRKLIDLAETELFPVADDIHIISIPNKQKSIGICFYRTPFHFCLALIQASVKLRARVHMRMQRPRGDEAFPWSEFFDLVPAEGESVEGVFTSVNFRKLLAEWQKQPFSFWIDNNEIVQAHWCAWWLLCYLTQNLREEPITQERVRNMFANHGKHFLLQHRQFPVFSQRKLVFIEAIPEDQRPRVDLEKTEAYVIIAILGYVID